MRSRLSRTISPGILADRDTLSALVSFNRDAGDVTAALTYAEQLAKIEPNNAELKALIETLREPQGARETAMTSLLP